MPLKYFINKDNEKISVEDVLSKGLMTDEYPSAFLKLCASQREWKGKASVTQCLQGTREAYLKILCDYSEKPSDSAFRVLGTRSHAKLEQFTMDKDFSELHIPEQDINGTMDLLECQPNGDWWIIDYKTSGSYVIAKSLGITKKTRPAIDDNGEPIVYKKSGHWGKAGDQKMETYYEPDPLYADFGDWPLQLNKYRLIAEQYFNIKVSKLKIFAIVRDGGTQSAKNRGVMENVYYLDIPILPDNAVDIFFKENSEILVNSISSINDFIIELSDSEKWEIIKKHIPPICEKERCWDGLKCKKYCSVAEFCKQIGDNHYLKDDKDADDIQI